MREEIFFGNHRLVFEGANTVKIDLRGFGGDEIVPLFDALAVWSMTQPYTLVLVPLSGAEGLSAAARQAIRSPNRGLPPRAVATYDGTFALRVAIDMVMRATRALGIRNRLHQHATDEIDARRWLESVRPRLATLGDRSVDSIRSVA
jgi:hypothetical protein